MWRLNGTLLNNYWADEEIKRRIQMRTDIEEEPEVLAQILNIKQRYKYFANYFNIPLIDTTNKSYEEIIAEMNINDNTEQLKRKCRVFSSL